MDSKKDMEEFQGREVIVSQLLDWDSLNHQLVIPAHKAEAFMANCMSQDEGGKLHAVTIIIDGEGYKAFVMSKGFTQSAYSKQAHPVYSTLRQRFTTGHSLVSKTITDAIQLIYSPQLADALKNKFNDLYKRMSRNRERKDVGGLDKTHIYLVTGDSADVFILHYSTKSFFKPNVNSWRKLLKVDSPFTRPQMDTFSKQSTQVSVTSNKDTEINEKTSELSFTSSDVSTTSKDDIGYHQSESNVANDKSKNESYGRKTFVSQLLDWDSLTHELIIPADKAQEFKSHYNSGTWRKGQYYQRTLEEMGKTHPITILFNKGGYKATACEMEFSSSNASYPIHIQYSDKLAQALKNKFHNLYLWLLKNKDNDDSTCPEKICISLTASYSVDIFCLNYSIQSNNLPIESTSLVDSLNDKSSVVEDEADTAQTTQELSQSLINDDTKGDSSSESSDNYHTFASSESDSRSDEFESDGRSCPSSEVLSFSLDDDIPSLEYTKPIKFSYECGAYIVHSWADLLVKISKVIYKTHYGFLLKNSQKQGFDFSNRYCLGTMSSWMDCPKQIGHDLWIETNLKPLQMVHFAKWLVQYCMLKPRDFIVQYQMAENIIKYETANYESSHTSENLSVVRPLENESTSQLQLPLEASTNSDNQECMETFSLDQEVPNLHYTKPIDFIYQNKCHNVNSWMDFIVQIAKILVAGSNGYRLQEATPSDYDFTIQNCIGKLNASMIVPKHITNDLWIETAMSATKLAKFAQWMVKWCYLEPEDFIVHYKKKNNILLKNEYIGPSKSIQNEIVQQVVSTSDIKPSTKYEDVIAYSETQKTQINSQERFSSKFIEECRQILENAFVRGFKNGSVIDKNKFARKYEELMGKPLTDENVGHVWEACSSIGIVVDDKVFPLTEAAKETVKRHVEELIQNGARQIYFTSLFDQFLDEFCENGIGSSDVLAAVLSKLYPEYMRTEQFLQIDSTISAEDEIVRVLREYGQLTLDGLQENLPGMTEESILQACKACKDVMKDGDKYILLDNIQFDEEEIIQARNVMESSIEDHGYVMLREINLENSLVLNDDISFEALAKVAFSRYFADDFSLANSLVSRKGESLSVSKIVKAFCEDHTHFTLKEVEEFANQINGYDSAHSLGIAQDNAIQVDDEHFVNPSLVDFDVDEIDKAIESAMTDKMQPLQAFQSFFNFPAVPGYPWTLKLLASYCRLASHEFKLLEHAPNNVSIGIIIHKNIHCNGYYQAVAMIALNDGIPMDSDSIGNYAIRKGFLNRKRPSALSSILSEMKQLSGEA